MIRSFPCRQHIRRPVDRVVSLSFQFESWRPRRSIVHCRRTEHPASLVQRMPWIVREADHFSTFTHQQQPSDDFTENNKGSQKSRSQRDSVEKLTKHLELDFFGEPVTFLCGSNPTEENSNIDKVRSNSMAASDGFLLCAVSKGKSATAGGDEGGLEVKSAHSAAVAWTEALIHAMIWNPSPTEADDPSHLHFTAASTMIAPMLAVVAVAPVLVQTGLPYVRHLDTLLAQAKSRIPGLPPVQMMDMARNAVQYRQDQERFNERECLHLQALHFLLENEYPTALATYLRILRSCPGDALAMTLAMDLSWSLGDKSAAMR